MLSVQRSNAAHQAYFVEKGIETVLLQIRQRTLSALLISCIRNRWLHQVNLEPVSKNARFANYRIEVHAGNDVSSNRAVVA